MYEAWLGMLLLTGCPTEDPPKGEEEADTDADSDADTDTDTDTDTGSVEEPDATGVWTGECEIATTATNYSTELLAVEFDLVDDAGVVTGTMTYTLYYTGSSSTSGTPFLLEGSRTGTALELLLVSSTTTTSTSTNGYAFDLELEGDTLDGTLGAPDYPTYNCAFTR